MLSEVNIVTSLQRYFNFRKTLQHKIFENCRDKIWFNLAAIVIMRDMSRTGCNRNLRGEDACYSICNTNIRKEIQIN